MLKKIRVNFSLLRWLGVVIKEIHELRRDRISIAMVVVTPLLQLTILGYAVNMDARNIPAALINYDTERLSQVLSRQRKIPATFQ